MAIPGILMRMLSSPQPIEESEVKINKVSREIEAIYKLKAGDDLDPGVNTIYFLSDITPLVSSSEAFDEDVKANASNHISISWVIGSFINGRDKSTPVGAIYTMPHVPSKDPLPGSVVIVNGSTPRPEKEEDYHAWYDQEHGDKLRLVPGWTCGRRYRLAKLYGSVETASFYGINFYDADNGLGGPEWKAGVTEWTMRIRANAAKPNIRRQWKVVAVEKPE